MAIGKPGDWVGLVVSLDVFLFRFACDSYRTFMRTGAKPAFAKGRIPVTSIDPSDQQLSLPRVTTARAAVFLREMVVGFCSWPGAVFSQFGLR